MTTYSGTNFDLKGMTVRGINLPMKTFEGIDHNFWSFAEDNMKEHLAQMKSFEIRDDDVFICTYPRSGTNWVHEMVHMLLNRNSDYGPLFVELDYYPIENVVKMKSPRILCSHLQFENLPTELNEKGKVICVLRNPKDVAVSYHNLMKTFNFIDYNATWDEFLPLFLDGDVPSGSWFRYVLEWEKMKKENKRCSLMTVFYEDLKLNLIDGIQKISDFLGLQRDEQLISDIAGKCEFKNMYKEKSTNVPEIVAKLSTGTPTYLYRKGEIGDWKNWFTVAQDEYFDSVYKDKMKNSDLTFRFSK